ncbi:MAG: hypothetical protein L7T26_03355 [Pseudomonadales bacterium]|nr:hypothetical protein [Pseudomonadales bacterium]
MNTIDLRLLDPQINRLGLVSVIVVVLTTLVSFWLPLDVPNGFEAQHADRVEWLNANRGIFIIGWINQIISMLAFAGVFFGVAWHVAKIAPLRGIVAAVVVLLSVAAFIIPKFIAVWTIPQLASVVAAEASGAEMANQLLLVLNVSVPFSLYTSFDYLGFWLYAVFALLVAGPLFNESISSKTAAVGAGLFGCIFHGLFAMLLLGEIASAEIETYFLGSVVFLLLSIVAIVPQFRTNLTP